MDLSYLILLSIGIIAGFTLLGVKIGHVLGSAGQPISLDPVEPSRPQVVVNVPADYKPMAVATEDGKPLEGERARLWYAAYCKAVEGFTCTGYSLGEEEEAAACETANSAVRHVYGDA